MDNRTRQRLQLVLIAALFAAPMLIALLLSVAGWSPSATRNFGELVNPPQDITGAKVQQLDGTPFVWRDPNWQWTLLAVAGGSCGGACLAQLDLLHRARLTLNQNADRVRLVYLGAPLTPEVIQHLRPITLISDPTQALNGMRPSTTDTIAAGLVDPSGLLMLRYPAGYDANGLKKDLTRLIH